MDRCRPYTSRERNVSADLLLDAMKAAALASKDIARDFDKWHKRNRFADRENARRVWVAAAEFYRRAPVPAPGVALPPLPEMESAADMAYVLQTPEDWDEDYKSTWQKLQVEANNKRKWRAYAFELRAALAQAQPTLAAVAQQQGDARDAKAKDLGRRYSEITAIIFDRYPRIKGAHCASIAYGIIEYLDRPTAKAALTGSAT